MSGDKKQYGSLNLGEKIKSLMIEENETQDHLAEVLSDMTGDNITRTLISKWISGDRALTKVSHLKALCEHFDVSADYLLFDTGHALSIDPDVTAAMNYTGLSEDALAILAVVSEDEYQYFDMSTLPKFKEEVTIMQNAPLINSFICKGIEQIVDELQSYSICVMDTENYIKNTGNYLVSDYSDIKAASNVARNGRLLKQRLRLTSLSLGDSCKSIGDSMFDTDAALSELEDILSKLEDKTNPLRREQ